MASQKLQAPQPRIQAPIARSGSVSEISEIPNGLSSCMLIQNPSDDLKFPENVSLNHCQLPNLDGDLKGYIKTMSSKPKIYKENCLLMQIAKVLCSSTDCRNICYAKKVSQNKGTTEINFSIIGVICDNGYILLPRRQIDAFKKLTRLFFNVTMLPDIAVYHQTVDDAKIWIDGKMDQKAASRFLSTMKKSMITPLLIIEEESSNMCTTAQSLAAKLIEQFRLVRAQKSSVTQVTGFAFPSPSDCDFGTVTPVPVDDTDAANESDDDDGDVGGHSGVNLDQSTLDSNFNTVTPVRAPRKRGREDEGAIHSAPTKVEVSWDAIHFRLKIEYHVYKSSEIELDTFPEALVDAVHNVQYQIPDADHIGCNFTLQLNKSELREVEKMIQSKYPDVLANRIKQLPSAPSFVFVVECANGEKLVAKIFVDRAVRDNFSQYDMLLKDKETEFQNCCTSLGLVLRTMDGPSERICVFPYLMPPLPRALARSCVLDLGTNLQTVLHELHLLNISHMDVRLPNICFSEQIGEVKVKLIDFERSRVVLCFNTVNYGKCCTYPKQMYCIYIDFIQLMWMIFWIMLDDSTVVVYHEMDKLTTPNDECLDLQTFICTKTEEWIQQSNQQLSYDEHVMNIQAAMTQFWKKIPIPTGTDRLTLKDALEIHKTSLPY